MSLTDKPNEYKRGFKDGEKFARLHSKEEAVEFAEWINKNDYMPYDAEYYNSVVTGAKYTLSELYEKFKGREKWKLNFTNKYQ